MEHLGTLLEMGKTICAPLQSLKENEYILDKKTEELSCREKDVQEDLESAKLQYGKRPKREVEFWLKNVQTFNDKVHDIKQKLGEVKWTQFHLRFTLAKEVEEMIKEAVELKENGQFHGELFVDLLASSTETFPSIKLVGETTALKNLQKIEECLMEDEVGMVGVYGMGGVGKTTIMMHIHNKFKKTRTFNNVIWVTVSKESNLEELQDRISKTLNVDLSNNKDALCKSAKLFEAFKRRGRFLLILDDMWSTIPLTKVGVPEPNQENKCKVVWTTRSRKVCRGMGSQRTIKVDALTKDESWTLFKEKLGANFVLSPEIKPIAKAVVEECDGLPLGIITVGAAMRGVDDTRIWRNALEDLKNSRPNLEGLENDVFSCLKFSFVKLKTQTLQDCFLYCALYPEDEEIVCDLLIEKWIADRFFDDIEDREKAFDKGYTIINDLQDACMLQHGIHDSNSSHVKMHDLLRDLAIAITRKSHQFVVKASCKVDKFLRDDNLMDDVIRVSLIRSNIGTLSCQSKCPKLSTLLLEGSRLGSIDDFFFEHMQSLRVLDLSETDIRCLPQSLSNLVNLRALLLRECFNLIEVPSIVQLRELRVLDLSGTSIKYLPKGMDGLTHLRCLGLCYTREIEMVSAGIISKFSHLEELSMVNSRWKWSLNENENGRGAGVEEIVRLTHLKKLLVGFMDLSSWSSYVRSGHWRGLNCFILTVGDEGAFGDVTDAQYNFYSRERQIYVSGIIGIECINSYVFRDGNLTELLINDLHNLRTMYTEELTQGDTLANLKYIQIINCPKLKYVFSFGWFQTLQSLERIDVYNCQAMQEMVVDTGHMGEAYNYTAIILPRLKKLALIDLPKMKSICNGILVCTSLKEITVNSCPMLKKLPFSINSVSPSSLERIEGSRRWWDLLEWDNPDTKMHLGPFFLENFVDYDDDDDDDDDDDATANEEEKDGGGDDDFATANEEENEGGGGDDDDYAVYDDERRGTKRRKQMHCQPVDFQLSPTFVAQKE